MFASHAGGLATLARERRARQQYCTCSIAADAMCAVCGEAGRATSRRMQILTPGGGIGRSFEIAPAVRGDGLTKAQRGLPIAIDRSPPGCQRSDSSRARQARRGSNHPKDFPAVRDSLGGRHADTRTIAVKRKRF